MPRHSGGEPLRPIEILHAAETGIGGVNSVVIGLGQKQIGRLGEGSVHVLVPRNHAAEYAGTGIVTHVFERRLRSVRSFVAFTLCLAGLLLKLRPSFVILHSSFAGLAGRIVLALFWPWYRPVVIYCAHGWAFTMSVSAQRARIFAGVERVLARLSSAIVCISEAEYHAAIRFGLPTRRLHLVPNGTPRPDGAPCPNPYPSLDGTINLLFVGRLDRQKGIDLLVTALTNAPFLPISLTVVGRAVTDPVKLERLSNITYIDWLRPQDLAPYYAHADAVVVPSRWEGYGLVAAEAMSFGTPVVASRIGGLATLVEDGVSGFLFDPASAGELHDVLSGLDRETLMGMRTAAFRRWEQVADIQDMERRYFILMQSLAANGHRVKAIAAAADIVGSQAESR
ncbi:glycosyltransferase [Methylobacterium cerastii]|uniref:glycosyltransferase n=1 Tax=Methylobacterium cerastii TaxID=932741 RepID=UPI001EE220C2|nr:glycosyltransferase [Methylobacterium cerastii]